MRAVPTSGRCCHQAVRIATDAGPVVVEGNWQPAMTIVQRITRVPILSTEYGAAFAESLDLPECQFDDRWLADKASWDPL